MGIKKKAAYALRAQDGNDNKQLDLFNGKYSQKRTKYKASATSIQAYISTQKLRLSERKITRNFFELNSQFEFCRADLSDLLNFPINHITRTINDLLAEGSIEVVHIGKNPRTGRSVEFLSHKLGKGGHNG